MSTEFQSLCRTIVTRVYGALGSTLASEEIVQLASELAVAIVLALGEADEPVPEVATFAMETFFRSHGIVDVGDEWRWVN
jgi:hypothetical protein